MHALSSTSLLLLLSVIRSLEAASRVKSGSRMLRMRPSRSDSPRVIDATDGQLDITNKIIAPDGFPRSAIVAGGTFPGPLIRAEKGNDFSINVANYLYDTSMDLPTTIHWHGIYQNRSNWADGVSFVTQCPIEPGQDFQYQFNAEDQAGTFWYHSHHDLQYCDGLRGPLIIYDPDDPHAHLYDVDDENTVIMLADWYHMPAREVITPFTPNATTINGKGRYPGGPKMPLAVINVEQGKRYRFRVIAANCDSWHNFTIDGHSMTIIEADGVEVIPQEVHWLQIHAGQRYSVVVAADQPIDNYRIRALPNRGNQTFIDGQNSAILRYAGAPTREPTTNQSQATAHFEESRLHPLQALPPSDVHVLGEPDVVLSLVPGYHANNETFTINGFSFQPPPVPVLLQILSGARHPTELLPVGTIYELPRNKVIEINIPANDHLPGGAPGAPHGIHLHGHDFHVIRTATNNTPNYIDPPRRDTVSMGTGAQNSNLTIRFVTNNAGPWILHCHIDFHFSNGFAVVMAEAPDVAAVEQNRVLPSAWSEICPAGILEAAAHFNETGNFNLTALNTTNSDPWGRFNGTNSRADTSTMPPSFSTTSGFHFAAFDTTTLANSSTPSAAPTLSDSRSLNRTSFRTDIGTVLPISSTLSGFNFDATTSAMTTTPTLSDLRSPTVSGLP